ncbi:MAG: amino acid permease [Planctomycetes bacterium]|nr:amino acid permease [Planctomycetota bacterium]
MDGRILSVYNPVMENAPKKELSLFDSTCMIVGIIVGVGIYMTASDVAKGMGSWQATLAIWLVGGMVALCGALCYGELAGAYPQHGGEYVYLSRAYGPWAGFLFGWSKLVIIRPGNIALAAFTFAEYARTLYAPFEDSRRFYAATAVVVLTAINILGVTEGKWTQNALTVLKALGLLAIVGVGLAATTKAPASDASSAITLGGVQLAMILVLYTFGGWSEIGYIAAEVKRPERNIARALIIGVLGVTALYFLANAAFLHALGYANMAASKAVAVDTVATMFPHAGSKLVAILVCISALGGLNGIIFTGSRVSYALGADHAVFQWLGRWSSRFGTPVWALSVQGAVSLGIVLKAGSFLKTLEYMTPVVWVFFLGAGVAVFVLRRKEPDTERPSRAAGYPVTPIVFCISCVFMLYSGITWSLSESFVALPIGVGFVLAGGIVYWLTKGWR